MGAVRTVRVHAPHVAELDLFVATSPHAEPQRVPMQRDGGHWNATIEADDGSHYWLVADGVGPLVDPAAADVVVLDDGTALGVFRGPWPGGEQLATRHADPVVYELHVRGFARTFDGVAARLDHLVDLGVNVIELMPVHPFDPADNYWGYMPLVWGAVHRPYAAPGDDPAAALAAFVARAHERGIEVWLDVVFNHTGEGDAALPTRSLRGLDDRGAYLHHSDGRYVDDSGCGNTIDPSDPTVRELVLEALERFAALGIDGFRFDLASILTRDGGGLVRAIGDWASRRGVRLVAEAWDLAAYQVGPGFPDARWAQWNDRFRDDVRGFLRGEAGRVPGMIQRVQGSPDLFPDDPARSINFVTAHDGLTLHDLTIVTSDRHHSWDCGPALRPQMVRNAFCLLLLSAGTPMFVMGDEFARTQQGHDNPYDIDSPLTWVDWTRFDEWRPLYDTVRSLIGLRRRTAGELVGGGVRCYGVDRLPDETHESRSLAWATDDLYVMANMWWEPLTFTIHEPGPWRLWLCTADADVPTRSRDELAGGGTVVVPPRSVTVLTGERLHP
jgi:glycogen operon protein